MLSAKESQSFGHLFKKTEPGGPQKALPCSAQRRASLQSPVAPGATSKAVLEKHADDSHHCQTTVGDLSSQLLLLLRSVGGGEHLEVEVAGGGWSASGLVLRELAESAVGNDLSPASVWHLGDGTETVRDVGELESSRWGQVAWELASDLRGDVAHGGQHRDPAMLQFGLTTARKVLHAAIGSESSGVPKANWRLHAKLRLEGTQWGAGVEGPVAPGAASEAVLEEHTNDGHHRQTTVGDLSSELLLLLRSVGGGEHLE